MSTSYHLRFLIREDNVDVLEESVHLEVRSLRSINDRAALELMRSIIHDALVPKGSTVLELRALNGVAAAATTVEEES